MATVGQIVSVPSQASRRITAQRCGPADLQPIIDWLQPHLAHDYFFKRGHFLNILRNDANAVWWLSVDDEPAGVAVQYMGTTLHNLYLTPAFRRQGIGADVLHWLNPSIIRAKTNMADGDPVPFYRRNGYGPVAVDPARPWIVEMHRMAIDTAPLPAAVVGQVGQLQPKQFGETAEPPLSAATAPPTSLVISGDLLAQFRKYCRWQLASKRKAEQRRAEKRARDTQRSMNHFVDPPGYWWNGRAWVQGTRPAEASPPPVPVAVPGTISSLDQVAALFGDGDGGVGQ